MISDNPPDEIKKFVNERMLGHQCGRNDTIAHFDEKYLIINRDHSPFSNHYCGYTWLKSNSLPRSWSEYSNIYGYDLDIHGGLTFSCEVGDYIIYGFDCAHFNDEDNPKLKDISYLLELCQVMRSELIRGVNEWYKDIEQDIQRVRGGEYYRQ